MVKVWYTSKELALIQGLPSTIQGINRKARVEGWKSRKRSGIQGKAVEYHLDSFPDFVKAHLMDAEDLSVSHSVLPAEPLRLWVSAFLHLKNEEQDAIVDWLIRNGVKELVHFVQKQNHTSDDE